MEIVVRTQSNNLQTGLDTKGGGEEKVEDFQRIIQLLSIYERFWSLKQIFSEAF